MRDIFKSCFAKVALVAVLVVGGFGVAAANDFDKSDDRIKTMVYNKNEVYTILTRYGFATAIEISRKEKIQAISIGDSVGWKLTPAKNRIFVKPLLNDGTTNLSIITDKRTYQFELIVSSSKVRNIKHAYVVRFFYPSENAAPSSVVPEVQYQPAPVIPVAPQLAPQIVPIAPQIPNVPTISAAPPFPSAIQPELAPQGAFVPPQIPEPAPSGLNALPSLGSLGIQPYNFNYTLTGPEHASPKKIFDDGNSTYFEFDSVAASTPAISAVTPMGTEQPLSVRLSGNKYVVDAVAPRFVIRYGNNYEQICVFNEAMLAGDLGDLSNLVVASLHQ